MGWTEAAVSLQQRMEHVENVLQNIMTEGMPHSVDSLVMDYLWTFSLLAFIRVWLGQEARRRFFKSPDPASKNERN